MLVEGRADPRLARQAGEPERRNCSIAWPAADGSLAHRSAGGAGVRLFGLSMIEQGRAIRAEGYLAVTPQGNGVTRSGAGALVVNPSNT